MKERIKGNKRSEMDATRERRRGSEVEGKRYTKGWKTRRQDRQRKRC